MTHVGSLAEWSNLLDSQVPDILALIIETWEEMPAPAANAKEDPISEALCRKLRLSHNRCNLPFHIYNQLVELDPAAGEDQGRMDIVFSLLVPSENIYFCLECKRLNVRNVDGNRSYFVEYVRFGMLRFVRGQYSRDVRHGGMLAFVLDGNVPAAMIGVEENINRLHRELGMDSTAFQTSSIRPTDARVRETRHCRPHDSEFFMIHHLFMAGDPNADILGEPETNTPASLSVKPRKTRSGKKRK